MTNTPCPCPMPVPPALPACLPCVMFPWPHRRPPGLAASLLCFPEACLPASASTSSASTAVAVVVVVAAHMCAPTHAPSRPCNQTSRRTAPPASATTNHRLSRHHARCPMPCLLLPCPVFFCPAHCPALFEPPAHRNTRTFRPASTPMRPAGPG